MVSLSPRAPAPVTRHGPRLPRCWERAGAPGTVGLVQKPGSEHEWPSATLSLVPDARHGGLAGPWPGSLLWAHPKTYAVSSCWVLPGESRRLTPSYWGVLQTSTAQPQQLTAACHVPVTIAPRECRETQRFVGRTLLQFSKSLG